MSKKNFRMNNAERAIHDRAVSLRKMTDQALCDYMDRQRKEGMDAGLALANQPGRESFVPDSERAAVDRFIDYLDGKRGSGNGIGGGTIYRLRNEADRAERDGILAGVNS